MTSTLKSTAATDLNLSLLVDGQTANAGDVTTPFVETETNIDEARETVSVSPTDTHVKHLNDAIAAGTGISKSIQSASADEKVQIAVNTSVVATNTNTMTLQNKTLNASNDIALGAIDPTNDGGAASGNVLIWNGSAYAPGVPGGGGAVPKDITTLLAGETLAERNVVYLKPSDSKWYKVDTNASPPKVSPIRGVVNEAGGITSGNAGSVRLDGEVSGFSGLTTGGIVYASTTAGSYAQTRPNPSAGGGQVAVVVVGWAISTTKIMVEPFHSVGYLKREELAADGSLTIEHQSDPQARDRQTRALISTTLAGPSLESYADTNQDTGVALKLQVPATYGADQCTGGTASASTSGNGAAANAFDDNNATVWGTNTGVVTGWLEYDFGTAKIVRQYILRPIQTGGMTNRAPNTWTLEYYDGATWQVADAVTGESGWAVNEERTFTVDMPYSAARWRLNISLNNGGNICQMAEMQLKDGATYTSGPDRLAQSFQLSAGSSVGAVLLYLKKIFSPTGNLTVKIQPDSAGNPSGTPVANGTSQSIAASSLGTAYGWVTFTFSTPPALSGSTTYWLVLETTDSQAPANAAVWGADASSPSYASGEMKSETSSTWNAESKDAVFDVAQPGTNFDEPCAMGRWSGGARDIGVRFDDGADANGDTNTTFKNVSGATLDVTCIVELR